VAPVVWKKKKKSPKGQWNKKGKWTRDEDLIGLKSEKMMKCFGWRQCFYYTGVAEKMKRGAEKGRDTKRSVAMQGK